MFQSSEQVAAREAYDLLARSCYFVMIEWTARVWMVFTRFDALTPHHYGIDPATVNILDNIAKTLEENKVPPEQVLLVGNEFYRRINAEGSNPLLKSEQKSAILGLALDGEGRPLVPEGFRRHPVTTAANAFEEVIKDGGIGKMRAVIGEMLADRVESEVRTAVENELRAVRSAMHRIVRSAYEAVNLDRGGFRRAVQWKVKLQEVRRLRDGERQILESPTEKLIEDLGRELTDVLFPTTLRLDRANLRQAHLAYARVLEHQAMHKCASELTRQLLTTGSANA